MKKTFLILVNSIFDFWLIGLVVFNHQINQIIPDEDTKTEAIVVLTGGRHRLTEAIRLLNNGMADKLFISGVQKNTSVKDLETMNEIKIPKNKEIILDKIATNTFENARETSIWINKHNIKSIRLVTSNYHMFRSLIEFRRWNKKTEIILHPVFSEKVASSWWQSFDSFYFLACEYNKLIIAWLRAFIWHI